LCTHNSNAPAVLRWERKIRLGVRFGEDRHGFGTSPVSIGAQLESTTSKTREFGGNFFDDPDRVRFHTWGFQPVYQRNRVIFGDPESVGVIELGSELSPCLPSKRRCTTKLLCETPQNYIEKVATAKGGVTVRTQGLMGDG
jgi:hypothetical protein